jgi:hypothetical protein
MEEFVMIMQLHPVTVHRDAPPEPLVEGCEQLGMVQSPSVRWSRVNRSESQRRRWLAPVAARLGLTGEAVSKPKQVACDCGQQMIWLLKYRFTLDTGEQLDYRIGQCERCQTIHWDSR